MTDDQLNDDMDLFDSAEQVDTGTQGIQDHKVSMERMVHMEDMELTGEPVGSYNDDKENESTNPATIPLADFFLEEWNDASATRADQDRTLEGDFEDGTYMVYFHLIRELRTRPELRNVNGRTANALLKPIMADLDLQWSDFPHAEGGASQFVAEWNNVRLAADENMVDRAFELAKLRPLTIREQREADPTYIALLSLAYHLARLNTDDKELSGHVIFPCRKVGEVLGISHTTAAVLINLAECDGYLRQYKPHGIKNGKRTAAEYVFASERFHEVTLEEFEPRAAIPDRVDDELPF